MPFKALGLHPMHYTEPTPVQQQAIPAVLAGHVVLATAQTGTGKTAAYLLPLLHRLLALQRGAAQALVVTPTRELAQQVDYVLLGLELLVGGGGRDGRPASASDSIQFSSRTPPDEPDEPNR